MINDADLLQKYCVPVGSVPVHEGCWVNFLGLNTRAEWFPSASQYLGKYLGEVPIPDDKVYGGMNEYASLLRSIESRGEQRDVFSVIELGAGWGPWISAAGVVCKRLGFQHINLVGVEADKPKALKMFEQLEANDLTDPPVKTRIIHGAAWSENTTLFFPKNLPMHDYGGAVSQDDSSIDYRGMAYTTTEVKAYSFQDICEGIDYIDYAHWDLQGAEWKVALSAKDYIERHVRHIFIGTHSRLIEGNLLELFLSMNWDVLLHTPCGYSYDRSKPTLEAMTHTDGELFVRNPRLANIE